MSDEPSAPKEPPAFRLLSFVSGHFGVFSLLGLVAAVLCSTLFLYGYLTVFDWQLIWIIEYPDILKFGLVGLAVISGILLTLQIIAQNITNAIRSKGKSRAIYLVLI